MGLKNIDFGVYKKPFVYENYICTNPNSKIKEYEIDNSKKPIYNHKLSHIKIYYPAIKKIIITTPTMVCPFGFEKNSNNFQIKLQFTNYQSDNHMNEFYNFISSLELDQIKYIGLTSNNIDLYKSQIFQDPKQKYDPLLMVKIPFINNKFNVNVYNDTYNLNITNIHKFSKVKCDIYIDSIWLFNDKYICKWKLLNIHIL